MKTIITFLSLVIGLTFCFSQNPLQEPNGGEYTFNPSQEPCVTDQQRTFIEDETSNGIELLRSQNRLAYNNTNRGTHPLFIWPVQKASHVDYNEIWGISNYVDHDATAPNSLLDYNCGTRTYDTTSGYNHRGLDVYIWPFSWYAMDNDQVEIIAGAPGQIIAKSDGNFDRSCDFNTTTPWNAVYIQHSDGSIAWYGHLKNGSLTTKNIGDMVSEGEFLGIMGSSGVSTGPHLHFEVWTDATYTQLVDPYSGTCNSMNTETWWQSQRPYNSPGINAVLTHSASPVFPNCPTSETTNIKNQFDLNETVTHFIYLRDQVAGTIVNLRVIRPDNTDLYNWDFNLTNNYYSSYWGGWTSIANIAGEWKWEATYNGETVTHSYNVGALSIEDETLETTSVYPNPTKDVLNIDTTIKITSATIIDVTGKSILEISNQNSSGIESIDLTNISKGLYFLSLNGESGESEVHRFIKN
ncbi:peptidoglycan DD-metalloendopeptidase family protein [Winogradskyella sp. A2]|uniref:peptidoglycan DD-metalloendopeptidase family protein n=1 Tax=Winogradskyella sp. A2 TaxID=3366944 RepID=UPI00398C46BE